MYLENLNGLDWADKILIALAMILVFAIFTQMVSCERYAIELDSRRVITSKR